VDTEFEEWYNRAYELLSTTSSRVDVELAWGAGREQGRKEAELHALRFQKSVLDSLGKQDLQDRYLKVLLALLSNPSYGYQEGSGNIYIASMDAVNVIKNDLDLWSKVSKESS